MRPPRRDARKRGAENAPAKLATGGAWLERVIIPARARTTLVVNPRSGAVFLVSAVTRKRDWRRRAW
eukprot:11193826-Lingulodinium_polyedra.AAC.1